jgi:hypothetical protein
VVDNYSSPFGTRPFDSDGVDRYLPVSPACGRLTMSRAAEWDAEHGRDPMVWYARSRYPPRVAPQYRPAQLRASARTCRPAVLCCTRVRGVGACQASRDEEERAKCSTTGEGKRTYSTGAPMFAETWCPRALQQHERRLRKHSQSGGHRPGSHATTNPSHHQT